MSRRKCLGNCGRWLTNEESIARGYGKHCAELHGIPVALRAPATIRRPPSARTDQPVEIHPGQTALPLIPFQPTLESL